MYTGTTNNGEGTVQVQCIATSNDGVNFEKFEGNPVILPNFIEGNRDFRDPKVWKEGDLWYVVIGTTKNNEGRVLLYSSPDLREWEFVSVLAESHGELGSMWECPDFFRVGDKQCFNVLTDWVRYYNYNVFNWRYGLFYRKVYMD